MAKSETRHGISTFGSMDDLNQRFKTWQEGKMKGRFELFLLGRWIETDISTLHYTEIHRVFENEQIRFINTDFTGG